MATRGNDASGEPPRRLSRFRARPGRRSFVELEADAVRQWETIEQPSSLARSGNVRRLKSRGVRRRARQRVASEQVNVKWFRDRALTLVLMALFLVWLAVRSRGSSTCHGRLTRGRRALLRMSDSSPSGRSSTARGAASRAACHCAWSVELAAEVLALPQRAASEDTTIYTSSPTRWSVSKNQWMSQRSAACRLKPTASGVYWNANDIVLEDVDRVEVIRAPGATLWGVNAVNGVINIITNDAADTHGGLVAANYGTEEQPAAVLRYRGGARSSFGDPCLSQPCRMRGCAPPDRSEPRRRLAFDSRRPAIRRSPLAARSGERVGRVLSRLLLASISRA